MTDTETPEAPAAAGNEAAQRQVLLQKIYVKDASLEVPLAPEIFTRQWQPQMDVQVNTEAKALEADSLQVVLSVTVTAKLGEDVARSEEHTSELQSLMRISYAVFCLKKKNTEN